MRTIGRYALFDEIASGGMATVHLGRLIGPVGFSRTVAIKRLHNHFAKDPDFSAGFVDEARLAARIHHPNVVPIIDVLAENGELSLVMDYVEGESLARLLRQASSVGEKAPLAVASSILCGTLYGLHAAHEAVNERGKPMHLVHRDVSPQNILVGTDGTPRLVDFGVAKAAQRLQTTAEGQVKGKLAYMAPEQIRRGDVTRQVDVYAAGVVLWELITGKRLFQSDNPAHLMTKVLEEELTAPSEVRAGCPPELDRVVLRALCRDTEKRYATAREMAQDLQSALPPAPPTEVGDWVQSLVNEALTERRKLRAVIESQEVTEESTHGIAGRPHNEDLATIADRRPITVPGLGELVRFQGRPTTVTGLTNATIPEKTRFFVPLIAGLLLVMGAIITLLLLNTPFQEPSAQGPDRSLARGDDGSPSPPPHQAEAAPPTPESELGDGAATIDNELALGANRQESSPTPPDATTTSKTVQKPADCPKFYEDAEGIRRVNRKCWK